MKRLPRWAVLAVAALAAAPAGCANLIVKKVPVEDRVAGADNQKGFRYYLSRPYVMVNSKVKVAERRTLIAVTPVKGEVAFLEGPRAGQVVRLDDVRVREPASNTFRPITPTELQSLRKTLNEQLEPRPDAGVVPAAADGDAPAPNTTSLNDPTKPDQGKDQELITNSEIQILYLPDLDEQYAIKSCNVFSKSAFRLDFSRGWRLDSVTAEQDSTPVALELLRTIDKAIDSARQLEETALSQQQGAPPTPGGAKAVYEDQTQVYYLVETTWIKPGLYRLNKPWECDGAAPTGCGFLAQLGLPTVVEVALRKESQQ